MFPIIRHIDDVLPFIKDFPNFYVNDKGDYFVIDYILNTPDMFNNSWQKECRGLLFYKDGRIMARRLHKFFNLNERDESRIENIDFQKPHVILEKLDGSMISPIFTEGKWTWGSMAGKTSLTPQIEEFVASHPDYQKFAQDCVLNNWTPIFEWCTRKNRIVIDYPKDRLVLLAVRHNQTGVYETIDALNCFGIAYNIDVVKQYEGTVDNMQQLADNVKEMKGLEGFVVRFDDGQWVKIKADEYCLFHKTKENINFEKNVVSILAEGKADDFRTLMTPEDRKAFEKFEKDFWICISEEAEGILSTLQWIAECKITRKEFALSGSFHASKIVRSIVFDWFNRKFEGFHDQIMNQIRLAIKKHCGSATDIDKVRHLWASLKWDDYKNKEG